MQSDISRIADALPGQFCWADLAAKDAGAAQVFYTNLFGWAASTERANGGVFTRFGHGGKAIGSLYQLSRSQLSSGASSHWTPYVAVANADETVRRAKTLGGAVVVEPFDVARVARIALILDAVGAPIGLWSPLAE